MLIFKDFTSVNEHIELDLQADLVFCLVNNNVISGNDIHLTKDTLKRIVDTPRYIFVALVGKRFRPVGTLYITKVSSNVYSSQ